MKTLLALTVSGSALTTLLLMLRYVLLKKMPSTVYYYAWLLVLLRFLLPLPGLVPSFTPEADSAPEAPAYTIQGENSPEAHIPAEYPAAPAAPMQGGAGNRAPEPAPALNTAEPAAEKGAFDWRSPALWLSLWAAGAVLCFGTTVFSYARFMHALRRTLRKPDAELFELYGSLPGRKPALYTSDALKTPLMCGVLQPRIILPAGTVSFSKPGKNKVQAAVEISGVDALTFSSAGKLADPVTSKGAAVYAEEGDFSAKVVNEATGRMAGTYNILTWLALALTVAGLVLLLLRKNRKLGIALFLAALVLRCVTWLVMTYTLPKEVAVGSGTLWLYLSMLVLVFAAFFTNFVELDELPKKYKLFLMMLPFLVAVFLFSYLPLYGWSYAFYNYKFGVSMDQQEFVGLKWFTEMFTNEANRVNIFRVLKNTFGMSGLNLLTSWLPMVFAIFLNEITQTRFKKFVQIFTTLPNFISWALVFSFAMCLFAMDTGIFSKFMEAIGAVPKDSHIVWLNSSEHIWLKMWGWNTWKGLGWGAIMYLAAIAGIDQELYEAAQVDGANRWHKMRYITLPGLLPTFFVLLMLSISNILNNGMEQYLVFQNPMNKNSIEVLDLYVYNITIASRGTTLYSYATAIGILKTIVSVTLLFSANFASKKLRGESIM